MLADVDQQRAELTTDERARMLDPAVQIDRRDQRLVAVREQRLLPASTGLLLPASEQQMFAELQPLGLTRKRRRRDERRLGLRLLALVEVRKLPEEQIRDHEPDDRVAE